MTKVQTWLLTVCGCFALLSLGLLGLQGREAIITAERSSNGVGTKINAFLDSGNATLGIINAPCTSFHGSATCGTLAQLDQTEKNFGIFAGQTALQVKQSGVLIEAAARNMNTVSGHLAGVADAVAGTANAATGTAQAATRVIRTADSTIAEAQPLVGHLSDTASDSDAAVKKALAMMEEANPSLQLTARNSVGITSSANVILGDVAFEADKFVHPAPQPWYVRYASDFWTGLQVLWKALVTFGK